VPDPAGPDQLDPLVCRVVDAAARNGVHLGVVVLDSSTHTAAEAAMALGVDRGQIVKSLVFVAPGGLAEHVPVICLVAGTNRVDLARLAGVVGEPTIRRATAHEARELTGFPIGGIPPLGHARTVRVVMDPDLERYAIVWAAAGIDRAVFPIAPAALRDLTDAIVAPVADASAQSHPDGRR
jgi:prolyl-tRNA editing enzyme YbaK/EbsC (Cys-tRNA(Pro) deacylase)